MFIVLCVLLVLLVLMALSSGSADIGLIQSLSILLSKLGIGPLVEFDSTDATVVLSIRLPRVILGMLAGASLAAGGAAIQGLFRNPLAEPGLIGTSAGGAVAAVIAIMVLAPLLETYPALNFWLLPISAFIGSTLMTYLVFKISQSTGLMDISTMLLAGVAINAFAFALMGLAIYFADDLQLRSITFWTLGSLSDSRWKPIYIAAPLMIVGLLLLPLWGRRLDALSLGESEAYHLGIPVTKVRGQIILVVALIVGASVSLTGMIGFVGLVVPHMLRMLLGPSHRTLVIGSALAGAVLLLGSDLIARTVIARSELPLGVITALIGAPYFLWLLLTQKKRGGII